MGELLEAMKSRGSNNTEYVWGGKGWDNDHDGLWDYDCGGLLSRGLQDIGCISKNTWVSAGGIAEGKHSKLFTQDTSGYVSEGQIVLLKNADGGWHVGTYSRHKGGKAFFYGMQSSGAGEAHFGPNARYWNNEYRIYTVNCKQPPPPPCKYDWLKPFAVQTIASLFLGPVLGNYVVDIFCPRPTKPEEAGPEKTIDPLVLDLDGDGISTLSQENGVFFDFDANGFHELSGWIGAGSGLLMLDLNGNGELDDGSELFGDFTMMPTGENAGNGFHALSQYDDNQDGRIDANDAIWSQLGVYYDSEYYTPQSAGGG